MEEKPEVALAKRLAAYAASAGLTLAVAPEAGAQVVYHDLDPDGVVDTGVEPEVWYDIDVDDDGVADLRVKGLQPTYTYWRYIALSRAPGGEGWNGFLGCEYCYFQQGDLALRLSEGDVIGPQTKPYRAFLPVAGAAGFFDASGTYWDEDFGYFFGEMGYAGFRFVGGDGALRYGWLRLAVDDRAEVATIYEYAFESAPETPILAGARSVARLDGGVDSRTFPPSGGILRYTFTVTNTTDEPQPLDLWLDADGPAPFTRLLGAGVLAAGATVTQTVRVRVHAGMPAGVYDVRFKLGDFASGRFITFERYEIEKEGAAAGVTGEAFAVEPVVGNLFDEAASALPGTHALSPPSPNPTTGRAEVVLQVAETQAVRVEVLDALGRRVALLHDGSLVAGEAHRLVFDGSGLPSGVYVVRAVGETFADTRVVSLAR